MIQHAEWCRQEPLALKGMIAVGGGSLDVFEIDLESFREETSPDGSVRFRCPAYMSSGVSNTRSKRSSWPSSPSSGRLETTSDGPRQPCGNRLPESLFLKWIQGWSSQRFPIGIR